jgi:lysophospholipase L1-like esterase
MGLTVEKCLQAWTNSLRQMNAKADIVFFGDSLTYYGNFASVFPDKVVCNLGLRGDTIQGMIDRVEQVKILDPKLVFLMAGINDVSILSVGEFEKFYYSLVDILIRKLPNAIVSLQSILPINIKEFKVNCNNSQINICNNIIQRIAEKRKVKYLDIHSIYEENGQLPLSLTKDGIHLTFEAYKNWYVFLQNDTEFTRQNE